MEKMSTGAASGWFFLGWLWFIGWTAVAFLAPWSAKITPSKSAKNFFSSAQYDLLYPKPGKPKFNAQKPNPAFKVTDAQEMELKNWGFNDCVAKDGTASQDTSFLSGSCFCENAPAVKAIFDDGFAVQPANTLSTLTLSAVGLLILGFLVFADPPDRSNFMTATYFFALCYAGMTIILGPFSMMLHLGLHSWGGWFDSLSLYVWFGFVAAYGTFRFVVSCTGTAPENCPPWANYAFLGGWILLIVVPGALTVPDGVMEATGWYLGLGILALAGEGAIAIRNAIVGRDSPSRAPATNWSGSGEHWWSNLPWDTGGKTWFLAGGITFLLALTIWVSSFTQHFACLPDSALQGHAIFHSLSAVAAGFLYKYYRHEGEA